jgi:Na+/alanine symporter
LRSFSLSILLNFPNKDICQYLPISYLWSISKLIRAITFDPNIMSIILIHKKIVESSGDSVRIRNKGFVESVLNRD